MPHNQPFKILLAVDGSQHSQAAVQLAARMPWPPATSVCIIAVVAESWSFPSLSAQAQSVVEETLSRVRGVYRQSADTPLARAGAELAPCDLSIETAVVEGRPSDAIFSKPPLRRGI
jgi:hypothetical protein